jgi:hypothetical protein
MARILGKLDQEGNIVPEQQEDSIVNKLASKIESVTKPIGQAVEKVTAPIGQVAGRMISVAESTPPIARPLAEAAIAPVRVLQGAGMALGALEKGGEMAAEELGKAGVNPNIAAGVGTLISKAPDIIGTITGGGQLIKLAGKSAARKAALRALNDSAADIAKLPTQVPLPLGEVENVVKPIMKLEKMTAAIKKPTGEIVSGHGRSVAQIQREMFDLEKAGQPEAAHKLFEDTVKAKGLMNAEGKFLTPDEAIKLLEGQGQAAQKGFARELPFISSKSGITPKPVLPAKDAIKFTRQDVLDLNKKAGLKLQVPEEQISLFKKPVSKGVPTEPIVEPPLPSKYLPGAEVRLASFKETPATEIGKRNPLTSRVEYNKKLGKLEDTAYQQYKVMGEQANKAEEATNAIRRSAIPEFKPKSIESETLFNYIENPNKTEFMNQLTNADPTLAQQIKVIEPRVRQIYDELLNKVNRVRQAEGLAPIVRRENYVTHFDEISILDAIGELRKVGTPEGTELAQAIIRSSEEVAKGTKFAHVADITFRHIRRALGQDTEKDAVSALARYSKAANNYIHMQPVVNEMHESANLLKARAPNAAKYIEDQADFLAGKTQFLDQALEDMFGKEATNLLYKISSNAKSNILLGRASTILHQAQGLLPTVADNSLNSVRKGMSSLFNTKMEDFALANSNTLQARALDAASRKIGAGPVRKSLQWMLYQADYQFAKLSWFTRLHELRAKGLPLDQAIKGAEEFAAMSQGHTSLVNTPPLLRAKAVQEAAAFQNQAVANARYLSQHVWKGKKPVEAAQATLKLGTMLYTLQAVEEALLDKQKRTGIVEQFAPMMSALTRGLTGPGMSVLINPLKAKTTDSFIKAAIKSAFLAQNVIPAGGLVGEYVAKGVVGEPQNTGE